MSKEFSEEHSQGLFKGLFFGLLLGVGLSWFLSTPEGEKMKKKLNKEGGDFLERARDSLDETLKDKLVEGEVKK